MNRLARDILAGVNYKPHEVITLDALSKKLGVTRAMAREVTQILNEKGLIKMQARVGATIQPMTSWDVLDPTVIDWRLETPLSGQMQSLAELRAAIEPAAARLAAIRRSPEVRRDLVLLSDQLVTIGTAPEFDSTSYHEADARFHDAVLTGSQNELFRSLSYAVIKVMHHRIDKYMAGKSCGLDAGVKEFPTHPELISLCLHRGVAHAIDQRSPEAAEAFMKALLMRPKKSSVTQPCSTASGTH